ncbi:hypothetical protein UPYG_G00017730 [Umbra pygmaea]|uniref:Platelet-derived growth factor (PDGF) family profile domain-containing protein n=1 Tax=Umbra pygmaea TaxID=75934 RepID=A0ABD0XK13_UMBPY
MWSLFAAITGMMQLLVMLNLAMPEEVQDDKSSSVKINQEKWERDLHSAASLEELLMVTDFPDWKLWKCRRNVKTLETSPLSSSPPQEPVYRSRSSSSGSVLGSGSGSGSRSSSSGSVLGSGSGSGSHRSTRYAGESISREIIIAVEEEWKLTQCMPRETCVDVAKELGTTTSMFFKPHCVSVFRCNGCCSSEAVSCRNTSTSYVNKTLLSVVPFKFKLEAVLIKVANHTECKCMEPPLPRRQTRHHKRNGFSTTRQRSEPDEARRLCASGFILDLSANHCIPYPSNKQPDISSRMEDCEMDMVTCDCIPTAQPNLGPRPAYPTCHLNHSVCADNRQHFDHSSCRCHSESKKNKT